jgi:hypothetical protein
MAVNDNQLSRVIKEKNKTINNVVKRKLMISCVLSSRSRENKLSNRPTGVVSKKLIGLFRTLLKRRLWTKFDARKETLINIMNYPSMNITLLYPLFTLMKKKLRSRLAIIMIRIKVP